MTIEQRLTALPNFIYLDEEDRCCPHCNHVLKAGVKKMACTYSLWWNVGRWILEWRSLESKGYAWKRFEAPTMEALLDEMEKWIEDNKKRITPDYKKY